MIRPVQLAVALLLGTQLLVPAGASAAPPPADAPTATTSSCAASWSPQKLPAGDTSGAAVAGVSSNNLYGVASLDSATRTGGFRILHNTGAGWKNVTTPPELEATYAYATSLTAPAANEAWVAATLGENDVAPALYQVIGSTVSAVPLPAAPADFPSYKDGFMASSAGSTVWVAGEYSNSSGDSTVVVDSRASSGQWTTVQIAAQNLDSLVAVDSATALVATQYGGLFQVSGTNVTAVPIPDGGPAFNVAADGPDDVWVVGSTNDENLPLLDHFDGSTWTRVALPAGQAMTPQWYATGLAVAPTGILWMASDDFSTGSYVGFLDRYDPGSGTWASTVASLDEGAIAALDQGNVYASGHNELDKLCQLPVGLSTGARLARSTRDLADGIIVTAPAGAVGTATVSDTTGTMTTGPLSAGEGGVLSPPAAGTYTLHSTSGGKATLTVSADVTADGNQAWVTIAEKPAPSGYAYQARMRKAGTSAWKSAKITQGSYSANVFLTSKSPGVGHYQVESRVVPTTGRFAPSGWSPAATVSILK